MGTVTLLQTGQWLTPTMNAAQDQSNTNLNNLRYLGGAVARPDLVGNPIPKHRTRQLTTTSMPLLSRLKMLDASVPPVWVL